MRRSMTITMSRTTMMGRVVPRAGPNDVTSCAEEATPSYEGGARLICIYHILGVYGGSRGHTRCG